ncbi:MAG TPA: alpha/beta fold hydrolase [Vicinamibacterales bacterium]
MCRDSILSFILCLAGTAALAAQSPIVIRDQGARPFGGRVLGDAATGSIHCDHGYVEWQIPQSPRRTPLVMVHASSTKTWDTTFDGRDGFRQIFLRQGFPVYLTDLPRTGRAGQGCAPTSYAPRANNDQASFTTWRIGLWLPGDPTPDFYPGVQFSRDPRALNEFFRIQYPEFNAPENEQVETDALAALLSEVGPSVLLTHSSTGIRGWITATKSSNVAGIVSYEPGDVVFPEGEAPPAIERADGMMVSPGRAIPMADFLKLTKMPIQIVWGDYIPSQLDKINVGPRLTLDGRRINVVKARLMVEAINRHGGHAVNVMLPDLDIRGNTHFPMSDLNNAKIADLLSGFLRDKELDKR